MTHKMTDTTTPVENPVEQFHYLISPYISPAFGETKEDTFTENGMSAYSTTTSKALDFFSSVVRDTPTDKVLNMFVDALKENFLIAMCLLFHLRDARKGKQEKAHARSIMNWLSTVMPKTYMANFHGFIQMGYLKDVLHLDCNRTLYKHCSKPMPYLKSLVIPNMELTYLKLMLMSDYRKLISGDTTHKYTLAAKWAPTEGTHFDKIAKATSRLARLCFPVSVSPMKDYRKMISALREHLRVVERLETQDRWTEINYSAVPATCMRKQKGAFRKHDELRFDEYLKDVSEGKIKMNTSGVQVHELVKPYVDSAIVSDDAADAQFSEIIRKARESGTFKNTLALVDVSGSMSGTPITVAVALGLVIALTTDGPFGKKFLTFSETPELLEIKGSKLSEMVYNMVASNWGCNTNLMKAFDLLLTTANMFHVHPDQMVKKLFIFTDMQFDQADNTYNESAYTAISKKYQMAGYELPQIIFWNLRDTRMSFPVLANTLGVSLMSGFSQEMIKLFLTDIEEMTPLKMMLKTLEPYYSLIQDVGERYSIPTEEYERI